MSGPSDKSASAAEASTTNPYTKYYNSPTLSDVVICYGDNGERVFYGHKLQLSAKAQWFENAFTHGFAETGTDKVTLHEDDPAAVEGMLKHIYGKQLIDLDCTVIEDVFFAIGLYRIADKYDCPSLETEAPDLLGRLVAKFFDQLHTQEEMSGINDLYKIVSAVYDFDETRSGSKSSTILRSLISCIFANNAAKPFEGSQVLSKVISKVRECQKYCIVQASICYLKAGFHSSGSITFSSTHSIIIRKPVETNERLQPTSNNDHTRFDQVAALTDV
ncbi:hypothetical protein HBI73_160100 [Parastagonospora nodorum]|nr:hypothetical protein HBH47_108950 [Parastagonospora nodorum]KAH5083475.1 hypothetical protein HBI73_160100 [Parastagonospora nodorum]KAH5164221.1 hypothetical protein HBH69_005460 [Parastagonospora nodorum]KAH5374401.1 hypothetical protein HBI49_055900 [Parastagonospora nodorum]KAH5453486.1 hypothetical protein HBI30_103230 [Parastagonospora nodorum]